jgi:hypothetical protein
LTRNNSHANVQVYKGQEKRPMNDVTVLKETYLTRPQAIAYIRAKGYEVSVHYLSYIATLGLGPPYKIFGTSAIYTIADIDAWIASPRFRKTEKRGPAPKKYA